MGNHLRASSIIAGIGVASLLLVTSCSSSGSKTKPATTTATTRTDADANLALAGTKATAKLDPRYSSYNIEMVTVTGGSFWAPYDAAQTGKVSRPPVDLGSAKLRNLAKALGPAYIRVSGSWVNNTWFDPNGNASTKPPKGFGAVLTGAEWKGVGDFARAVNGEIVTSYANGAGDRDANGVWEPTQARARMAFTKANDIPVVAAEFANEPSIPIGVPKDYTVADYVRDFHTFAEVARQVLPKMRLVGPSATGDINPTVIPASIKAEDMVAGTKDQLDVFSYHFYPTKSKRCGGSDKPESVLDAAWLDRVDPVRDFYTDIRDRLLPKAPIWVTEVGEANCGGDPWASTYADVIRYVDTHGRLARGDGDVVFHNTLMGSDYGLLDEDTFAPRPAYWAAVLWAKLMGPTVLATTKPSSKNIRTYAQCTPESGAKGVTYAVINISPDKRMTAATGAGKATVYTLTGSSLTAKGIELNGETLRPNVDGTLPKLMGRSTTGAIQLPPASVSFVVDPTPVAACS